jgi:Holliday junction resolvasome RuvABC DNA-binding subunit
MTAIEARDKHIFWKIKGIATKIAYRLFSKYGNPKFAEEGNKQFSKKFLEIYAFHY